MLHENLAFTLMHNNWLLHSYEDAVSDTVEWREQFGINSLDTTDISHLVKNGLGDNLFFSVTYISDQSTLRQSIWRLHPQPKFVTYFSISRQLYYVGTDNIAANTLQVTHAVLINMGELLFM